MGKEKEKIILADLARVGAGTAAGEWFRRYWLAVASMADLKNIPLALKILGEELVLFRDGRGQVGLIGLHCPHRGTSLEYGDIEPAGIRCPYHGWLFDVSGQCLEQPAEPDDRFAGKVKHRAYPVREQGGLFFAYLGPDGGAPPPPPELVAPASRAAAPARPTPPAITTTTGLTSSRTAPTRCTSRSFTAAIPTTARGAAGFSTSRTFRTSTQSRRATA